MPYYSSDLWFGRKTRQHSNNAFFTAENANLILRIKTALQLNYSFPSTIIRFDNRYNEFRKTFTFKIIPHDFKLPIILQIFDHKQLANSPKEKGHRKLTHYHTSSRNVTAPCE